MIPGIRFLVDEAGEKTAVVIDLRKNAGLWEDFYDRALARQHRREPRESLAQVKARLRPRRRRPARLLRRAGARGVLAGSRWVVPFRWLWCGVILVTCLGFIRTDTEGRVHGVPEVLAVGDAHKEFHGT